MEKAGEFKFELCQVKRERQFAVTASTDMQLSEECVLERLVSCLAVFILCVGV